jgi:hypothetical protein
MPETVMPREPVENWEQVRDEWIAEVHRVIAEAETWSEERGWGTLRDHRTITEDPIGSYQVPVLLIHTPKGRLLLSPQARYVFGGNGLIDVMLYPSFDVQNCLVKVEDGWRIAAIGNPELGERWSKESFVRVVNQMLESS